MLLHLLLLLLRLLRLLRKQSLTYRLFEAARLLRGEVNLLVLKLRLEWVDLEWQMAGMLLLVRLWRMAATLPLVRL